MKTVVLVPARNAVQTIGDLIKQVSSAGFSAIVVDDGSTDRTFEISKSAGATVIRNHKNLGKGAALRNGFEYVLNSDFDAVITMDADGQHEPKFLKDFVAKAESTGSDLVLGNRMHQPRLMPLLRVFTNRFMSDLLSKRVGQNIPDTQCGYRLIRKELLSKFHLLTSRYEIDSEILIQAGLLGARIESIPISSVYDDQPSHINPFVDTLRFIRLILRSRKNGFR